MSVDSLGYTIALLVIGVSFIAVKYRNMLLTLGAATLWATLLAFILANTVAGTNWQQMLILGIVTFMLAFALISFLGRSRGNQGFIQNIGNLSSREEKETPPTRARGLMELDNTEYRALIRARMRGRRRR